MARKKELPELTPNSCVADAIRRSPRSAAVLRSYGLTACLGCAFAPFDSLAYAAAEHACDCRALVAALNQVARG